MPDPTRRVVVALNSLTTQVRRIADHLTTPVVAGYRAVDGPGAEPGTPPSGPAGASSARTTPLVAEQALIVCPFDGAALPTAPDAVRHYDEQHPEQRLIGPGPWPLLATPLVNEELRTLLHDVAATAAVDAMVHGQGTGKMTGILGAVGVQAAADEDARRADRRASLRVLVTRVNNAVSLSPDEAQLLARHVATEITDANDGRRRAEQAEDLLNVAHETSNKAEAERARAEQRVEATERDVRIYRERLDRLGGAYTEQRQRAERAEATIARVRQALPAIRLAVSELPKECRYHGAKLEPDSHGTYYGRQPCCDTGHPSLLRKRAEEQLAALDGPTDTEN